jgi:hypothetical protein
MHGSYNHDTLLIQIASNIRASKEDLMQAHTDFSDDLVELSDGGHPAVLATYHELHCLVSAGIAPMRDNRVAD